MEQRENAYEPTRTVSRRTIVKGAAWSVPVIAAAAAVPAHAAASCAEVIQVASVAPTSTPTGGTSTVTVTYTGTATTLSLVLTGPFQFPGGGTTSTVSTAVTPITFTVQSTGTGAGTVTITGTCATGTGALVSSPAGPGIYWTAPGNVIGTGGQVQTIRYTLAGGATATDVQSNGGNYHVTALDASGTLYQSVNATTGNNGYMADGGVMPVLPTPVPIAVMVPMGAQGGNYYFVGTDGKVYYSTHAGLTLTTPVLLPGSENVGISTDPAKSRSNPSFATFIRDDGRVVVASPVNVAIVTAANTATLLPALPGGATAVKVFQSTNSTAVRVLGSDGRVYTMSRSASTPIWDSFALPAGVTTADVEEFAGTSEMWIRTTDGRLFRAGSFGPTWTQVALPGAVTAAKISFSDVQQAPSILGSDGQVYRITGGGNPVVAQWSDGNRTFVDINTTNGTVIGMTATGEVWAIRGQDWTGPSNTDQQITYHGANVVGVPGTFSEPGSVTGAFSSVYIGA